jgi:hypothetical protein
MLVPVRDQVQQQQQQQQQQQGMLVGLERMHLVDLPPRFLRYAQQGSVAVGQAALAALVAYGLMGKEVATPASVEAAPRRQTVRTRSAKLLVFGPSTFRSNVRPAARL